MSARDEVLARIRGALSNDGTAPVDVPRGYRRSGMPPGSPEVLDQLVDRLEDYRAEVVRVADDDEAIGAAVAAVLARQGAASVIVPQGLPSAWGQQLTDVVVDDGRLSARALDGIPAVVTGSVVAVSETGTIVLDGSPSCGRRAITLVPDLHVCVVRGGDVVHLVPEGLARLEPSRPLTFISGPSATSDIELTRVEGVHGPRRLVVILAS